jgi:hypothetical protein
MISRSRKGSALPQLVAGFVVDKYSVSWMAGAGVSLAGIGAGPSGVTPAVTSLGGRIAGRFGLTRTVLAGNAAAIPALVALRGAATPARTALSCILSVQRPFRRLAQKEMSNHDSGLPGTVRTEEAGDLARLHGKRQIIDGQPRAVPLAEMTRLDHDSLQPDPEIVVSLLLLAGAA